MSKWNLTAFRIFMFAAVLGFGSPASSAADGTFTVALSDPSGVAVSGAPIEIFSAEGKKGEPARPLLTGKTNIQGVLSLRLPQGRYFLAVKKLDVEGDLAKQFKATAYPLVAFVGMGAQDKNVSLQTLKLVIANARIESTETFLQYYAPGERGKRARLDEASGHAGRVIKLVGAPVATLELRFPANAVGVRGMRTYTPTSFDFLDGEHTLLVRTYMYDGKIKDAHNIMMLGTDLVADNGNRLVIQNVQEKSGVEVPFEPKASILNDGVVTSFVSNITFISDESTKPAMPLFRYFYLDDKETPFDLNALVAPAAIQR